MKMDFHFSWCFSASLSDLCHLLRKDVVHITKPVSRQILTLRRANKAGLLLETFWPNGTVPLGATGITGPQS